MNIDNIEGLPATETIVTEIRAAIAHRLTDPMTAARLQVAALSVIDGRDRAQQELGLAIARDLLDACRTARRAQR